MAAVNRHSRLPKDRPMVFTFRSELLRREILHGVGCVREKIKPQRTRRTALRARRRDFTRRTLRESAKDAEKKIGEVLPQGAQRNSIGRTKRSGPGRSPGRFWLGGRCG